MFSRRWHYSLFIVCSMSSDPGLTSECSLCLLEFALTCTPYHIKGARHRVEKCRFNGWSIRGDHRPGREIPRSPRSPSVNFLLCTDSRNSVSLMLFDVISFPSSQLRAPISVLWVLLERNEFLQLHPMPLR